jgi:hypothetical protein
VGNTAYGIQILFSSNNNIITNSTISSDNITVSQSVNGGGSLGLYSSSNNNIFTNINLSGSANKGSGIGIQIDCNNNTFSNNQLAFTSDYVIGIYNYTASPSINNTFNNTNHTGFNVGFNSISQNTCRAIALWINNTAQTPTNTSIFQEVSLYDGANVVYAALINYRKTGFDNTTTFDFQSIVAENRSSSTGTPYYFYLELGP